MAPTIGEVTAGFWSSQASAICARGNPRASATSPTRSATARSESSVRAYKVLPNSSEPARSVLRRSVPGPRQPAASQWAPGDHPHAFGSQNGIISRSSSR